MKKTAVSILLIFTLLALCSCSVLPKAKNGMKSVTNNADRILLFIGEML